METISTERISSRIIVYAGLTAAAYAVMTIAFGPLSYGPLQFRVSGLFKPLALRHPFMAWALAIGVLLANLMSPFGLWDFVAMPLVSFVAARLCWQLRRWPIPALLIQAIIIAAGVAYFPLGIGAGLPWWPTAGLVFASEAILYLTGWFVLRQTPIWDALS